MSIFSRTWEWIKAHPATVAAIGVGIVAAWYLIFRPRSSSGSGGVTSVTYPSNLGAGGGGGGQAPSPVSNAPTPSSQPTIQLPYNPDFSVLGSITDAALRRLYESAYNLEAQINQATAAGNTNQANALSAALAGIQDQINHYTPATTTTTPATAPSLTAAQLDSWTQNYLASAANLTNPVQAFQQWISGLAAVAPQAVGQLTTDQWRTVFNTIEQSVAFNGSSPFRDPGYALQYLNAQLSNPGNVATSQQTYYYAGSAGKIYEDIGGSVRDVTSQFLPASQPATLPTVNRTVSPSLAKGR